MAARTNSDKASKDAVTISDIPPADLAEAIAAASGPAPEVVQLDNGTVRETNTVYEDRTHNPLLDADVEYEAVEVELDSGSLLTTYMDPVGGFGEAK